MIRVQPGDWFYKRPFPELFISQVSINGVAVKTAVYRQSRSAASESSFTAKRPSPRTASLLTQPGSGSQKRPFPAPFIIQVWLNDAAKKRPFPADPALLSQEAAPPRNGRFPWLTGLSPARESKAALRQARMLDEVTEPTAERVAYPAGLEAGSA